MAKTKKEKAGAKEETETTAKKTSPFKEHAEFEKEIIDFANKYKTTVVNHAKRTSDYFEISCYNYVVRYYELTGYTVTVENLQGNQYRYKCSPSGIQSNYSFFKATYIVEENSLEFEIQHNLAVQSSHSAELFTTPDIAIIKSGTVKITTEYYNTKTRFCYVENTDLLSFCEVKQFVPFPELLFNFIGVVNELMKGIMTDEAIEHIPPHIAPTLMLSGKPSKPTEKIKAGLEKRYCINIIFDLFDSGAVTFSAYNYKALRKCGKVPFTPVVMEMEDFEKEMAVKSPENLETFTLQKVESGEQVSLF